MSLIPGNSRGSYLSRRPRSFTPFSGATYDTVGRAGRVIGRTLKRWMSRPASVRAQRKEQARRRKTPLKHATVEQEGTGGSLTKVHYGKHKAYIPDSVLETLSPYFSTNNAASQVKSLVGQQTAIGLAASCFQADLLSILAQYNGGGTVNRVLVTKVRAELLIANAMIANACVTIYDVIARKDACIANPGYPDSAWSSGVTAESGSASTNLGSTPFDSELFNQYWKVVQTTRIVLGQGAVHRHVISYEPNRLLHYEYINNTAYCVGGLSTASLVVLSGMPANDSTTTTQVRLGAATLNIVQSIEYEARFPASNSTKFYQVNNLATSFTVAEEVISTGAGLAEPNTVA